MGTIEKWHSGYRAWVLGLIMLIATLVVACGSAAQPVDQETAPAQQ